MDHTNLPPSWINKPIHSPVDGASTSLTKAASGVEASSHTSAIKSDRLLKLIDPDITFTIFAHGTGHDEKTSSATINAITNGIQGKRFKDFIVVDGPAGHSLPSTYWYNDINKKFAPKVMKENFPKVSLLGTNKTAFEISRGVDAITGNSSKHSAARAVAALLEEQKTTGKLPGNINLVGYSRGAARTICHIVDELKQVIGSKNPDDPEEKDLAIKLNLFLIDPVPGGKKGKDPVNQFSENAATDSARIDNAFIVYSGGDRKPSYRPMYPNNYRFSDDVKISSCVLPGRHATLGSNRTSVENPSSKIIHKEKPGTIYLDGASHFITDTALLFLKDNGVKLNESKNTPNAETLKETYEALYNNKDYQKVRQKVSWSKDSFFELAKTSFKGFKDRKIPEGTNRPQEFINSLFKTINENKLNNNIKALDNRSHDLNSKK